MKDAQNEAIEESPRRAQEPEEKMQQINEKAINALQRVRHKLRGTDFPGSKQLAVDEQVTRLSKEATWAVDTSQSRQGWCPFW